MTAPAPAAPPALPPPAAGPLLAIRDLRKTYNGRVVALDGATVDVPRGSVGLLGPNGSGKTTLVKILLGLVRADSGEARVLGLDPRREAREIRRRVGYVPERDAYIPDMSGARYVAYCGELAGMNPSAAKARAHEVLDYVRMGDERYRDTQTYSTGMRQRVKIAQALVHGPEVVILDEPTNGLDPAGREEVLRVCRELAEKHGVSLLFSSHLLPDVEAVCREVVILHGGRVRETGGLDRLRAASASTWDARLGGEAAAVAALEGDLREWGWTVEPREGDLRRLVAPDGRGTPDLFATAARRGVEVRSLAAVRLSLEEVFLRAVRGI
ncbi:MAG: ABC transporter ATP-binding protein [Planctomycetales bacterium]|nr:ABC transporter ATP-binding protein [Planctomycetales bacterium]